MILIASPTIPPQNVSVKWKYFHGMAFDRENKPRDRSSTGRFLMGRFQEAPVLTCSFFAGVTMWGTQTGLLLKFNLEAGEEYLLAESQIACNTTGPVVILTFESYLLNYVSRADDSGYWMLRSCTDINGKKTAGILNRQWGCNQQKPQSSCHTCLWWVRGVCVFIYKHTHHELTWSEWLHCMNWNCTCIYPWKAVHPFFYSLSLPYNVSSISFFSVPKMCPIMGETFSPVILLILEPYSVPVFVARLWQMYFVSRNQHLLVCKIYLWLNRLCKASILSVR